MAPAVVCSAAGVSPTGVVFFSSGVCWHSPDGLGTGSETGSPVFAESAGTLADVLFSEVTLVFAFACARDVSASVEVGSVGAAIVVAVCAPTGSEGAPTGSGWVGATDVSGSGVCTGTLALAASWKESDSSISSISCSKSASRLEGSS